MTGATPRQLARLVDKSLLQWQAAGEERYVLHELLRQLAAEELQQTEDEAAAVAHMAAEDEHTGLDLWPEIWDALEHATYPLWALGQGLTLAHSLADVYSQVIAPV